MIVKIALLHHLGGSNLGDNVIFAAMIQNIRRRWPEAAITGLTMDPDDTHKRHGIPSYAMRQQTWSNRPNTLPHDHITKLKTMLKGALSNYPYMSNLAKAGYLMAISAPYSFCKELIFLFKALIIMRSTNLLIISGGGQLVESSGGPWQFVGGPWKFPYTLFKWALLARLAGVTCWVVNVGAGPLIRPLSKRFVRGTLGLADYVSVRDEQSRKLLHDIGFKGKMRVHPDSAYSLVVPACYTDREITEEGPPVVGLAPMAYGDSRLDSRHDGAVYDSFVDQLSAFGSWLVKSGYCVSLFCTDIGIDPPAVEDVERAIDNKLKADEANVSGSLRRVYQSTTEELLSNMSSMNYVVVCRFHAVVLAHMLNIPVLAINHHPKVRAIMNDIGLSEYCVDIGCDLSHMAKAFDSLIRNWSEVKLRMAEKLIDNKKKLDKQFDQLFPSQVGRCKSCDKGRQVNAQLTLVSKQSVAGFLASTRNQVD